LGTVGLGFALICLLLQAPDVAITQLVVEILTVVILIRATLNREVAEKPTGSGFLSGIAAVLFVTAFFAVSFHVFYTFPTFGNPIMRVSSNYLDTAVRNTGATNVVGAILLDFRGYDTLGEATVLFTAVAGVLVVARRIGRIDSKSGEGFSRE
jgi:multisubunit Na+/H+ antiporter MnhB subunit